MMNNKKQALEQAIKYFESLTHDASIVLGDNEYSVFCGNYNDLVRFKFVNVKDGDICIVRSNERDNISIYLCGRFRDGVSDNMSLSNQPPGDIGGIGDISDIGDIVKTGVNYFDLIN